MRAAIVAVAILVALGAWWLAEAVTKHDRAVRDAREAAIKARALRRDLRNHRSAVAAGAVVAGLIIAVTIVIIHGGPQ